MRSHNIFGSDLPTSKYTFFAVCTRRLAWHCMSQHLQKVRGSSNGDVETRHLSWLSSLEPTLPKAQSGQHFAEASCSSSCLRPLRLRRWRSTEAGSPGTRCFSGSPQGFSVRQGGGVGPHPRDAPGQDLRAKLRVAMGSPDRARRA